VTADPLSIAVIVGSTRPGRRADAVARWVQAGLSDRHPDVRVDLIDLADVALPMLDEPDPAIHGHYALPHTQAWAELVDAHDAYVFVTPEYNHSIPGVLKNAIDFLYDEWGNKAAGIVTYGIDAGGARAAEHLRLVAAELRLATVRAQVALSIMDDFSDTDGFQTPSPRPYQIDKLATLGDQVLAWGTALRPLHAGSPV
jgi:NAD(P)H-dependent FMN reductase